MKQNREVRSEKRTAGIKIIVRILILVFCFLSLSILFKPYPSLFASPQRRDIQRGDVRPAGEAVVIISESFVNSLLNALLAQPRPPTFPLGLAAREGQTGEASALPEAGRSFNRQGCTSEIALLRESGGVRTEVRFRDRRITAPIAFRGSYSGGLLGCFRFQGWAGTEINLSFDRDRQRLVARVTVREVNLTGVPGLANGLVTGVVQNAIDERLNPIEILRAEQLGARIPLPEGNALRLRARDVQTEIPNNELRLRIFYEVAQGG